MSQVQAKDKMCQICLLKNERNEAWIFCIICLNAFQRNTLEDCAFCRQMEKSIQNAQEFKHNYEMSREKMKDCELCQSKEKLKEYQLKCENAWMVGDITAEMGSSGALSEDINNPCRETELKKIFDQLKHSSLPNYIKKIHGESRKQAKDKNEMIQFLQDVFTKAENDMKEKKKDFISFFKINPDKVESKVKKQQQFLDLAVKNLQLIMFHEEIKPYQTQNEVFPQLLTNLHLWNKLADECYKLGCLMSLHNPPLLLDWKNKEPKEYLPPIKSEETPV